MKRFYQGSKDFDGATPNKVALVERSTTHNELFVNHWASTKSSTEDIIALATEIQKADNFIRANAQNKLQVIAEQMKFLHQQAQRVLSDAKEHAILHHAACNFVKHPGNIYHLYEKSSGQCYFSMLSPEEWGNNGPSQLYKGSYRLEHDNSWTPLSHIQKKDTELNMFDKHLSHNQLFALSSSELMSVDL
ncbi:uncharacterized protein C1orf50 homolog [Aphidius gifuensis]|uniref:uncharacterized protein C1orf50 homolog n=1 Tax=Aphidius gifuensis TaxID=684658 RepID=UPI001CDC7F0C|nr:uncharacterized protein C1orf50 homolog [Aphidius gifuensis]